MGTSASKLRLEGGRTCRIFVMAIATLLIAAMLPFFMLYTAMYSAIDHAFNMVKYTIVAWIVNLREDVDED